MGRNGTGDKGPGAGVGRGEKQAPLKFGVDIREQDLRFLHTVASIQNQDFNTMLETAICLGCDTLREVLTEENRARQALN